MRKIYHIAGVILVFMFAVNPSFSQNIWDGENMVFTKADFADWSLEENQDRLTDDLWLTRGLSRPVFNAAIDDIRESPVGTLWAIGSISDGVESLDFNSWVVTVDVEPPTVIGTNMVLYLIEEDIYIDIVFTSWTTGEGEGGGGFSYTRSSGTLSDRLWTGPDVSFTKANYADWTVEENQDRITANVWITRANSRGIFNIAQEDNYQWWHDGTLVSSPEDTEWAFGTIADGVESLDFKSFMEINGGCPPCLVDEDLVMHLVKEDIYIDVTFLSWTSGEGEGGGGFSYSRSTGTQDQRLWTGTRTTFTKENYADWTLAENQDRITDNVWITRADQRSIFNIARQSGFYYTSVVPSNTMWAFGKISDGIESLDFHYFLETVEGNPPTMLNQDMVLKILSKNIYVDIKFTSWTSGSDGGGGGFSYIRSTNPFPSGVDLTDADTSPVMYPNPTSDIITIARTFRTGQASLKLFDVQGRMVMDRIVYDQESLGVDHLKNGIYFFHIQDEGETLRGKIVIK